jgi:hypothetical protein
MTDQASHSYVVGLPAGPRAELLGELRAILDEQFPDGTMSVRYETWLWIAESVGSSAPVGVRSLASRR